jgi:hypothetical protein
MRVGRGSMDGPSCQDTCAGARGMAASAVFGGGGGSVGGGVRKGILSRCLSVSAGGAKTTLLLHGGSVDDRGYERDAGS